MNELEKSVVCRQSMPCRKFTALNVYISGKKFQNQWYKLLTYEVRKKKRIKLKINLKSRKKKIKNRLKWNRLNLI